MSSHTSNVIEKAGFQFEIEIKTSTISPLIGLGIFTKQFIPNGCLIWKYCRGSNVCTYATTEEVRGKLQNMDATDSEFFMSHVYLFDGVMNEILDDGKYWNHVSAQNHIQYITDQSYYASGIAEIVLFRFTGFILV